MKEFQAEFGNGAVLFDEDATGSADFGALMDRVREFAFEEAPG